MAFRKRQRRNLLRCWLGEPGKKIALRPLTHLGNFLGRWQDRNFNLAIANQITMTPSTVVTPQSHQDAARSMLNALTVDVEDYYQVTGFENFVYRAEWDQLES